jgi:hypothetical protein
MLEREKVHPGLGACQSEKQELELAQVALGLVSLAHREASWISLSGCHPNRVQAKPPSGHRAGRSTGRSRS